MTDSIADWLRAQLDEDERIARAATAGPWAVDNESYAESINAADGTPVVAGGRWGDEAAVFESTEDALHIAEHDPARVLREIDAKRQLLRALESSEVALRNTEPGKDPHDLVKGATNGLRAAVRTLTGVYADRPGYKESWRP